jgi:hypothetical protein
VEAILRWIGNWPGATFLQQSATAYLLVNAAHILGISLLLGAILPLDLRLMGCFRSMPLAVLGPFLSRSAAVGMALAILTGLWLFSVRPDEYLGNTAFLCKMVLLAVALTNVIFQHRQWNARRALDDAETATSVRIRAAASVGLWLAVLVAGRWIGFL